MKYLNNKTPCEVVFTPESMAEEIRAHINRVNELTYLMAGQKVEVNFEKDCKRHEATGEWQWLLTPKMNKKEWL